MKRIILLALALLSLFGSGISQNVFDPNDPIVRYSSAATYGTAQKPDTNFVGLQKWVANTSNGVSSGSGSFKTLSETYKAYFLNFYNVRLSFRVKYPKSFQNPDSINKKYPVALFLHGAGEAACPSNGGIYNNEMQLVHGGKLFAERVDNNSYDGFLVYPQLRSKDAGCWGEWQGGINANFNVIMAFLDSMTKYVKMDNDRLFVFGLSGGGAGSWRMAESYPLRVAKIAPTSGAGLLMTYNTFVHIPVWLATGGKDTNPSPAMAAYSESKVNEIGGSIRRSLYADLGHSSWYRHWQEPDFVSYMNSTHKANPLVFFNRSEFCPTEVINVKIGITPNFYAYEWQKDGELIATRTNTTNTIVNGASIISFAGNEVTLRSFGTYRVRFKRSVNAQWSDWSLNPAVISQKPITQTPPIQTTGVKSKVLPSLDGRNTVQLQLPPDFINYEWRRTTDNVVVSTAQIYEAPVGTYKARYAEPFGCGTEYSPIFKVVSAAGSPKPDAAKNLNVTAISQTTLRLDWSDNPNAGTNETGFEIYRATKAGGPYTLVNITAPNVVTYDNTSLIPNSTYYYIVRAVSESGAAVASNEGNAKTEIDNQLPTAPTNLEYKGSASTSINLKWKASTDNVGIGRYDIYANGEKLYSTTGLSFTVASLDSLTSYTFVVKAVDKAGNLSPNSNQVIGYTHRQGLNYKYYHGAYDNLPNFTDLTPIKTGVMDTVHAGAGVRTQDDNFAFLWEGRIYIPTAGTYIFETSSDDGSKLYLDMPYAYNATALVNNDGAHGVQVRTGNKYLTQGYHQIAITFAEVGGGEEMNIFWSNNVGLARERIPKGFLSIEDGATGGSVTAPSSFVATAAAYNKITLSWNDNSNDETGFEIVRSSTIGGTFVPIFSTGANRTTYTDSGLTASTRYFYKIRAISANGESEFVSAFTEANWKFNNNYTEASGGLAVSPSNTAFSTDNAEGTHSVLFTSSDYVSLGGTSAFPSVGGYNQRTVALWIKPSSTNNKRLVFEIGGSDNGLGLRFNSDDLVAGIASASTRNTITLSDFVSNANWLSGQWNHVALVYNLNTLNLYLNGVVVASNNALSFNSIGNSSSSSRLGEPSGTNSNVVFNDGSYTSYLGSMDNLYIIRGALSQQEINVLRANTFMQSSAVTPATPTAPVAPSALVATALSTDAVELKFNDNSLDETGFEVWRSSGDKTNNRKIATIPASNQAQVVFADTTLFANITYYYTVRASGLTTPSPFTAEVSATTKNTKPVIKKVLNFSMRYATTYVLPVSATDADGDILTFSIKNLPTFATIQNTSNGQMSITFSPSITRRGAYPMSIYVADPNNGRDTSTFILEVNSNDVPVLSPVQGSIIINEGAQFNVPLSATDNNGTAQMIWSFGELPSFATFTNNNNGSGNLLFKPTYSSSGEYSVTIFINDGFGAWTSRTIALTVNEKEPDETLQFDFRSQSTVVAGWNSVNLAPPTFSHGTITDTKLVVSPVTLTITKGTITASVQGMQTGNNSGPFPDAVMKDVMLWGFNTGNSLLDTLIVKVAGLDAAKKYDFTFHSGYSLSGDANSTTKFRIGQEIVTINYFQNALVSRTILAAVPSASGEIFITMIGDPNTSRGGVLSGMVIKSSFDDGSTPAKPTNTAAVHLQNEGVKLTWIDRAFNENAYHVFRSSQRNGTYTLLNESATNRDSSSYFDNTAAPSTTYYYYVRGINGSGYGVSGDTVQLITGNNKPVITAPNAIYIKTESADNTDFTVTDDAGDAVTVALEGKPSFAALQNLGGSNYRLAITPNTDHIGWFTIKVVATDNKGAVTTKNISVTVSDKNTRSVFINFGSAGKTAPAPWNNWLGVRAGGNVLSNIRDEKTELTPFTVTTVTPWVSVNDLGHITGNNSGVYPDSVLASGVSDIGGPRTIRINGLNNAKKYNVVIVGSLNEGTNASIEYVSGTSKDTLDARYNTNKTANLNGLVPAGGQITFTAARLAGVGVSYINALVIEEYDPSLPILNPINLYAEVKDRNSIDLSWSDRTEDEDASEGYILERATDSLFTQNMVMIGLPRNTSTYTNQGLTPNTKYWYRVRAKSAGAAFSDYSNRAKAITPASIVYVDFNYTLPDADFPWNSTFASPTFEATFENLINQSGTVTGLSLELTRIFNGEFTAGVNTGNNSGIAPDKALASNYWLDNTQLSQFKISGLNHARRYRIGFFGSSSSVGWAKGNYTATYTIDGRTVYLNSWMNSSKIVYIDNVIPDENGSVLLDFSTTQAAAYGFNAGLIIQDYNDPLSLSDPGQGSNSVLEQDVPAILSEATDQPLSTRIAAQVNGRMYPNPVTDFMNIDFSNTSENNNISVEVFDLSGRISYRKNYGKLPAGNNTLSLKASDAGMRTGVYIVTLSVNGKPVQAGKVIKAKN